MKPGHVGVTPAVHAPRQAVSRLVTGGLANFQTRAVPIAAGEMSCAWRMVHGAWGGWLPWR